MASQGYGDISSIESTNTNITVERTTTGYLLTGQATGGGGGSFLPLAGGTMAGTIDMDSNQITDVGSITVTASTSSFQGIDNNNKQINNISLMNYSSGNIVMANGTPSVVIGSNSSNIVMGDNYTYSGNNNICIGSSVSSTGGSSITVGKSASASGSGSISIGTSAVSSSTNAIQIGGGTNSNANSCQIFDILSISNNVLDMTNGQLEFDTGGSKGLLLTTGATVGDLQPASSNISVGNNNGSTCNGCISVGLNGNLERIDDSIILGNNVVLNNSIGSTTNNSIILGNNINVHALSDSTLYVRCSTITLPDIIGGAISGSGLISDGTQFTARRVFQNPILITVNANDTLDERDISDGSMYRNTSSGSYTLTTPTATQLIDYYGEERSLGRFSVACTSTGSVTISPGTGVNLYDFPDKNGTVASVVVSAGTVRTFMTAIVGSAVRMYGV